MVMIDKVREVLDKQTVYSMMRIDGKAVQLQATKSEGCSYYTASELQYVNMNICIHYTAKRSVSVSFLLALYICRVRSTEHPSFS